MALALEATARLGTVEGRVVSEAEGLEVALAEAQRERHALGGGEGGERRAVLLAEPVGDAPHRAP
ncbi:MAG: hypothetical protein HY615_13040 [Candidatus Rokubacteria bacterium]|nr:hypothetical protein [Candidatus Rokubacteria bacterium]